MLVYLEVCLGITYLLHPISQLKALIISVFITIQGFDKTMFREEITVEGQSRIVLTKTVPHEICKMDFLLYY